MNNFKVNDWVVVPGKHAYKIEAMSNDGKRLLLDTRESPTVAVGWWWAIQCKPWQPKVDEWCWFWDITDSTPSLGQFKQYRKGYYCSTAFGGSMCEYSEPFFGELPSFFKDQK